MKVLGIESSCDETGVALVQAHGDEAPPTLLAQALHSQVDMHQAYGGVVPELASRDHIRRVLPLTRRCLRRCRPRHRCDSTSWPTRAARAWPARCWSAPAWPARLAAALERPVLGVHHLEGHLLSPFLSADPPRFPFVALLVSGGHTQLMRVDGVGEYELLGETIDDAAGEAFDKSAKLLGLGYPGGPALARLAEHGDADGFALPRPLLHSGDLDFSFAGLKTAVLTQVASCALERLRARPGRPGGEHAGGDRRRAGAKSMRALRATRAASASSWPAASAPTPSCVAQLDARMRQRAARACTTRSLRCAPTTAR